jgi:hypothetical protein
VKGAVSDEVMGGLIKWNNIGGVEGADGRGVAGGRVVA